LQSPGLNLGSVLNRADGNSPGRAALGNVLPNVGTLGTRSGTLPNGKTLGNTPGNTSGNRAALDVLGKGGAGQRGLGEGGLRLNQGNSAQTSLRPGTGLNGVLNGKTAGGLLSAGDGRRVTPQSVNNFLSLPNNRNSGERNTGGRNTGGLTGNQRTNVLNVNARNNIGNIGNISNSFNRLNAGQITRINNNLNNGFRNHHHQGFNNGFGHNHFGFGYRSPYWNNWCSGVRGFWNPYGYNGLFGNRFWATNYCYFPWRRSYYYNCGYPYSYWWNTPTWGGLGSWFPNYGWDTPYYYGYGPGGNIVYSGGTVYMNEQPIATAEDFAASAAELAAVPAPANPDVTAEWLPLGTFALSENETDKDPSRVVQLAVDKEGVVSGTMHNKATNQTYPIQGRVDKETQRVAFTIGEAKDVVFETGIYNLTQQQTPVLVHGEGREETYLLLRVEPLKTDGSAPAAAAPANPGAVAPAPGATPAPPAPGLFP
jgi:hypothetical protein